jgi:outer membrane receptor protein involved in Fe transport
VCAAVVLALPAVSSAQEASAGQAGGFAAQQAAVSVVVRSESGEPIRSAAVRIAPLDTAARAWRELAESGAGRYESGSVAPGRYLLEVRALGYEGIRREVDVAAEREPVHVVLEVRPVPVTDLVAAVSDRGGGAVPGHATSRIPLDGGPRSLADRLAEEPGVQVRTSAGGRQVGSVRGSRPEGFLVLLDGLPVNDPLSGSADLSRIPVATLSDAVLVRGASPRFGPGALAGVLLLRSGNPNGTTAAAGAEIGAFGARAADAFLSVGGMAGTLAVGFRAQASDNDFEYLNRTLPEHPIGVRENADERGLHAWLSAAPAALPLFAQVRYDDVERGAPGRIGTHAFDEARYADRSLQARLGYGSPAGRISATLAWRDLLYRDPRRDLESRQELGTVRLDGSTWVPALALELSGYLSREAIAGEETAADAARWSGGVWLGRTFDTGRISIRPGISADASTDGSALNPEIALAAQLGPSWSLWGRAGRAYRLPSFADLYAPSAIGIRANPDLNPERVVIDAEVGVRWGPGRPVGARQAAAGTGDDTTRGGADLQAAAFFRETRDPIVWVASAVALWSPQNLDRLTAAGLEVRGDVPLYGRGPRVGGSLTLQKSRLGFGSNRNPMPYQPELAGDAYVGSLIARFWLRGAVRFVGTRTTTLAGVRRLPAYAAVRLDASRSFTIGGVALEAAVAIDNLLDVRYEETELFPEPGRRVLFRVEARR